MPTSKPTTKINLDSTVQPRPVSIHRSVVDNPIAKAIYILVLTTIGLIWLNQHSLSQFWQQTFHRQSPWAEIQNPIWTTGGHISNALSAAKNTFVTTLADEINNDGSNLAQDDQQGEIQQVKWQITDQNNSSIQSIFNHHRTADNKPVSANMLLIVDSQSEEEQAEGELLVDTETHIHPSNYVIPGHPIKLTKDDKVFFAGDSMMQGITPFAMRTLRKTYGIKSIDLSKQSTGLTYPKSFNWPKTISTTLKKHSDIRLMVMFLGPNDPWSMPSAKGKYLKFKSEAWEELYRSRIAGILEDARQANVQVIWVAPPNMRREDLSQGVKYLNTLYQSEVEKAEQIYVSVNDLFNYIDDDYSDYKVVDERNVKVRSGDGTHFSIPGQKMIAQHILTFIEVDEVIEDESKDEVVE